MYQSGDTNYHGHITKKRDPLLHWLLRVIEDNLYSVPASEGSTNDFLELSSGSWGGMQLAITHPRSFTNVILATVSGVV